MLSCYCDFCPPKVFIEKILKARVEHKCCECRRTIHPGEIYYCDTGLWDDGWSRFKVCERCGDLRESFSELGYCWEYGTFLSDYAEWLENEGLTRPAWLQEIFDEWRGVDQSIKS